MKKNIGYYLEDPSRLSEISLHDLNQWVEEMPYSQPLRLLVDMKKEQFVSSNASAEGALGVYFAGDYEPLTKKQIKKLAKSRGANNEEENNVMPMAAETGSENKTEEAEVKIKEILDSEPTSLPDNTLDADQEVDAINHTKHEVAHNLATDEYEDIVTENIEETNTNTVLVNEVSHYAADEVLEDEVENEILEQKPDEEINFNEVEMSLAEVSHIAADEIQEDGLENEVMEISLDKVEEISSLAELDVLMESGELQKEEEVEISGLVDYQEFVMSVDEPDRDRTVKSKKRSKKEKKEKKKSTKGSKVKASAKNHSGKKSKKSRKKKKNMPTGNKPFRNVTNDPLDMVLEVNAENESKVIKKKKKNRKALNLQTKEKNVVKKKGTLTKKDKTKGANSIKGKSKKVRKEIKYVVVNEPTANDFKLRDYEGVSKFTNWLLEQKSINGDHKITDNRSTEKVSAKKKKNKKENKGKKKKRKVLKVAQESVKKSQMIISEPLADILAAQGHNKKASKMYRQLGLIFPEKSSYFAAKIEKLKKK